MIERFNIEDELMAKKMPLVKAVSRLINESEWSYELTGTLTGGDLKSVSEEYQKTVAKIQNHSFSLKSVFKAIDLFDNKEEMIDEADFVITDYHDYQMCIDETAFVIAKYISPEVARQSKFCNSLSYGYGFFFII